MGKRFITLVAMLAALLLVTVAAQATYTQQAQLLPQGTVLSYDGTDNENFGYAVAVDSTTAIVGARYDEGEGVNAGAAYVYTFDGLEWTLQQRLVSTDTGSGDRFGWSVALEGDRALVGAVTEDTSGAVYVFERDTGTGVWSEAAKLVASDGGGLTQDFGTSVALEGDRAVVGAAKDTGSEGAAYVFDYDTGTTTWNETQKLVAVDANTNDQFGHDVALSGERILVGAWRHEDGVSNAGAAYVFDYDNVNTTWVETARILALNPGSQDSFGFSVALEGDRAVIGQPNENDGGTIFVFDYNAGTNTWDGVELSGGGTVAGDQFGVSVALNATGDRLIAGTSTAGTAYIFEFDTGTTTWSETAVLTDIGAGFGSAVGLDGDTALIGAPDAALGAGFAYIYNFDSVNWNQQGFLLPTSTETLTLTADTFFGRDVAISSGTLMVGAQPDAVVDLDSVYVYEDVGGVWTLVQQLQPPQLTTNEAFGVSIAISENGDMAIIGAEAASDVFVYERIYGVWLLTAILESDDLTTTDDFGASVALQGDTAVVGAPQNGGNGAVFVYTQQTGTWTQTQKLTPADATSAGDRQFGASVALDGTSLIIGAPNEGPGAVYGFAPGVAAWEERDKFIPADATDSDFGFSVAVDAQTVLVGTQAQTEVTTNTIGAAYALSFDGTTFTPQQKLFAGGENGFNNDVALEGDLAYFTADTDSTFYVYTFSQNGDVWVPQDEVQADVPTGTFGFGSAIAVENNVLLVGAPGDDTSGTTSGAAYLFDVTRDPVAVVEFVQTESTITEASEGPVEVQMTIYGGTVTGQVEATMNYNFDATDTATPGTDYTNPATVVFDCDVLACTTGATFTDSTSITITDDTDPEADEVATISIFGVTNGVAGNNRDHLLTITDDDTTGVVTVTPSGTTTSETGDAITFDVVLGTAPTNDVTITLSGVDATEGSADATSLTFTNANFATPQTITITGVDDTLVDGDIDYTVTFSSASADANYNFYSEEFTVTNTDDDIGSLTVTTPGGTVTSETGDSITLDVALGVQPEADVTVTLTGVDATEGSADLTELIFTTVNWDTPQTITITGVNDSDQDGDQLYTVTLAVAGSGYDGVVETVEITNSDDDLTNGVTVTVIGANLTTNEDGTGDPVQFNVSLDNPPSAPVTVSLTGIDASEGAVTPDPAELVFDDTTWNTPQTITITGVDDMIDDGNVQYTVTFNTTSTDVNYDGTFTADYTITNVDDDTANVTVVLLEGTTTSETGDSITVDLSLTSEPTADVTIDLTGIDATEGSADVTSLTFTPANYATPQTVTITGVDDMLADGDVTYTVTMAITTTDATYAAFAPTIEITNTDDDVAALTVTTPDGTTTAETGTSITLDVVLGSEPTDDVTVDLTGIDATEGSADATSLIFTPATYATPQTITITGVDDTEIDGDVTYTVTLTATSLDTTYDGAVETVEIINADDESAAILLATPNGTTTSETGDSITVDVTLAGPPTADVTVDLTGIDETEGSADVTSLTFTLANYTTPQTVTVTGQDDALADGDVEYMVTFTATSTDAAYDGVNTMLTITNTDDDTADIVIDTSGGTTTSETGTSVTLGVTLSSEPTADVTLSLTGVDTSEGSATPSILTFTPTNFATPQIITVTGVDDTELDGDVTYTLTLTATSTDASYNTRTATVSITNTDDEIANSAPVAVNDSYGVVIGQTLNVNAASGVLSNDSDPDNDSLAAVLETQPVRGTVTLNLTGAFTYTPNPGASGVDTFTYVANDGQANSDPATVTITLTAPDGTPPRLLPSDGSTLNPVTAGADWPLFSFQQRDGVEWYGVWIGTNTSQPNITQYLYEWFAATDAIGNQFGYDGICENGICTIPNKVYLPDGNYSWWMTYYAPAEPDFGTYWNETNFSVDYPPLGPINRTAPADNSIVSSLDSLVWDRDPNAMWYQVWMGTATGSDTYVFNWFEASEICTDDTCTVELLTTLPAGDYAWWMQAWGPGGFVEWTINGGVTFTVQ